MNKYQKALNKAVKTNIKLFPSWEKSSFCKRRNSLKNASRILGCQCNRCCGFKDGKCIRARSDGKEGTCWMETLEGEY